MPSSPPEFFHPKLLKLQSSLPLFFTYFKSPHILVIAEDKASLPFCHVLIDPSVSKKILLSVAIDYPTSINMAEVGLKCAKVGSSAITLPFYVSVASGQTFIGEEAYRRWELDGINLEKSETISDALN